MPLPESKQDLMAQLHIDPSERQGGARRRWRWVAVLIMAIAAAVIAAMIILKGRAVAVETATVEPLRGGDGQVVVLDATGYVTARREATVSSKITGKLADVLIEEGDRVKKNQVLARLDNTDQSAQLGLRRAEVTAARAQLGSLQVQLRQARRDLKRQQDLDVRRLTTTQAVEDARTKVESLTAQLEAQRRQVRVAEAQERIAQVNYNDTVIRAPFAGIVVAKTAQPGEMVSPISAGGGFTRTGICTIVDMDSLEVEVDVNEAYINRVKPGQPVEAVLDAYPDWKIPGQVIAIIPTADRSKATVRVRIALRKKDPRIIPDMGVRVSFFEERTPAAGRAPQGVLVPATAIVERDGHSVVFVVDGGRVRQREITPGQTYGDRRLVGAGLTAGDQVVRSPPAGLADGTRIRPAKAG